ncbi:uncharacterized protein F5147DRAFT_647031 [Suillus discolor]|uniref:Uncharacterized protein n=1 Tax=Suillus discolor TaxID=1912936 RepID=A0A9P7K0W8_9AGAM|nr:uncharacterized protein F5147DRAFT_647031 [Suillus discolor]KAG2120546.1 hypothetical protein F5147DRAFT_647031 [Suillus discolor]
MESPSSPSSTITTPPNCHEISQRSGKLIVMAMTCRSALLHYDRASKSMVEWCWPADDEGKKIPPSDLEKSRKEYNFQYPCCLCADEGGKEAYVEAAVYPWWDTITEGTHWTARCASDTCGYRVIPFSCIPMGDKEQRVPPVQFEWTNQEQTELLNRLASSNSDRIAANKTYLVSCHRAFSTSVTHGIARCSYLVRPRIDKIEHIFWGVRQETKKNKQHTSTGLDALPRLESMLKMLQEFQPYGFMMHILRISLSESPIDMCHHCTVRQSEDTWGIMHFHMKDDLRPLHTSQKDKKEINAPESQLQDNELGCKMGRLSNISTSSELNVSRIAAASSLLVYVLHKFSQEAEQILQTCETGSRWSFELLVQLKYHEKRKLILIVDGVGIV